MERPEVARRLLTLVLHEEPSIYDPTAGDVERRLTEYGENLSVREATPADILAAFVKQCEEDGRAEMLRRGSWALSPGPHPDVRWVLRVLNLSALLEPKPTEEVPT